ncbi:hypothetical protein [Terribacillus sp. DMT04]|uniref:hypothetical protein n=1 Tax=Terribacillus sp. DMT04 TaxID=2850441 RepID=UPI001C2BB0CF|nr:hypothetical protein [Terribacillus sp. DMT04]QXE01960.1 hypothetical protein KS242_01515 [Terribacillus sp. DMT04]
MKVHGTRLRRSERREPKPISTPFDRKYVRKAYLMGLLGCVATSLIFYFTDDYEMFIVIIISYVLFPFAKFFYDVLLGFRLARRIKKTQNWVLQREIEQFQFAMHGFFIFALSMFLAPPGMLFLLIRYVVRLYKVKRKNY